MEIAVNGIQMHYEKRGNGSKTILLIHGNGEDWHCFDRQMDVFAQEYTVIVPDSRGHGRSEWGTGRLTLGQIAADYLALLEKLGLWDVMVIGFSDGANIAMLMCLGDGGRIGRLVLAGGNLYPAGLTLGCFGPILLQYAGLCIGAIFGKRCRQKRQIVGLMVREPHIQPRSLAQITVPALVLAGEKDVIRRRHTQLIAKSLPNAVLTVIPNAGHCIFQETADQVNRRIAAFFTEGSDEA